MRCYSNAHPRRQGDVRPVHVQRGDGTVEDAIPIYPQIAVDRQPAVNGRVIVDQRPVRAGGTGVVLVERHAAGKRGVCHCTCRTGSADIPSEGNCDGHGSLGLAVQRAGNSSK